MPPPTPKSPACEQGKCTCTPACPTQSRRVDERLALFRSAIAASSPTEEATFVPAPNGAPKGTAWICTACASVQPGPGMHCGYAILLVEKGDLEIDAQTGRVKRATCVENPHLYRKAPHGDPKLATWKPHGT